MPLTASEIAHMLSSKRSHIEAFSANSTDAESPSKKSRKLINGKSQYTAEVQRVIVKKKKATYENSFSTQPPNGYAYLPVGFRQIKEQCRNICLDRSILYYVVSLFDRVDFKPTPQTLITNNIYRYGWHFPADIVQTVMNENNLTSPEQVQMLRNPLSTALHVTPTFGSADLYHLQELCKDLFPGLPDENMKVIIAHSFSKNLDASKRIGNQQHLPMHRRVQLATLAHIRHTKTDYDLRLKRKEKRHEARRNIENQCLTILLKWRGEDGEYELEERSEEVVVIDDGDEDTFDELDAYNYGNDSDCEVVGVRSRGSAAFGSKELPADFLRNDFANMLHPRSTVPVHISDRTRSQQSARANSKLPGSPAVRSSKWRFKTPESRSNGNKTPMASAAEPQSFEAVPLIEATLIPSIVYDSIGRAHQWDSAHGKLHRVKPSIEKPSPRRSNERDRIPVLETNQDSPLRVFHANTRAPAPYGYPPPSAPAWQNYQQRFTFAAPPSAPQYPLAHAVHHPDQSHGFRAPPNVEYYDLTGDDDHTPRRLQAAQVLQPVQPAYIDLTLDSDPIPPPTSYQPVPLAPTHTYPRPHDRW